MQPQPVGVSRGVPRRRQAIPSPIWDPSQIREKPDLCYDVRAALGHPEAALQRAKQDTHRQYSVRFIIK